MSTVPAIARPEGFSEAQDNWNNNGTVGIVRRASASMLHDPRTASNIVEILVMETFKVEDDYVSLLLVWTTDDEVALIDWTTTGLITRGTFPSNWERGHEYKMYYIDEKIYVLNTSIDVVANDTNRYSRAFITGNIIIPVALGYGEKIQTKISYVNSSGASTTLKNWVSYTSLAYDGNNQEEADTSRARDTATTAMANLIAGTYTSPLGNGTQSFIVRHVSGSITVALSNADRDDNANNGYIQIEVQSSSLGVVALDTDSIKAFNPVIQDVTGLPKYSVISAWKKVQPNPTVSTGSYYLKPEPVSGGTSNNTMYEVAWIETYAYEGTKTFDLTTVPYVYDISDNSLAALAFKDRPAGDDVTNILPYFVDNKINAMCGAQERLGFVVNDKVWWSKTDDNLQVWRTSAAQVLSTDAFGIGNAGVTTSFKQVVHHNKSMLFIGAEQQAKIDNDTVLVNGQSTMAITTSSSVDVSVKPIAVGSDVYLGTKVAASAGVLRYFTADTRGTDDTEDVTKHIRAYITGEIVRIHGNDNAETLAVQATEAEQGVIYICNINTVSADRPVHAWSRWIVDGVTIVNIYVGQYSVFVYGTYTVDDVLYYVSYEIPIFYSELDVRGKICLDNRLEYTVATDGAVINLPEGYPEGDIIVVAIDGDYPFISETNVRNGNVVSFNSVAGVHYMVGFRYESIMTLSTIYRYNQDGQPMLNDRLRIKSMLVHMAEMYRLYRRIIPTYDEFIVDDEEMVTESYTNMSELYNLKPYRGSYEFSVGMNTTDCNVAFVCDYELIGVITGLTYKGMLHNSQT